MATYMDAVDGKHNGGDEATSEKTVKWIGISSDEVFVIEASEYADPCDLAEEHDANYVTDENGARSILEGLKKLLG